MDELRRNKGTSSDSVDESIFIAVYLMVLDGDAPFGGIISEYLRKFVLRAHLYILWCKRFFTLNNSLVHNRLWQIIQAICRTKNMTIK